MRGVSEVGQALPTLATRYNEFMDEFFLSLAFGRRSAPGRHSVEG